MNNMFDLINLPSQSKSKKNLTSLKGDDDEDSKTKTHQKVSLKKFKSSSALISKKVS